MKAVFGQWLTKMSGPLTVPFTILAFFVPQTWLKLLFATLAILSAGVSSYVIWAAERNTVCHLSDRLSPKLEVSDIRVQRSPNIDPTTNQRSGDSVWVQLEVKCSTNASVENCVGHLIKMLHKPSHEGANDQWEETEMNESLPLGWSLEKNGNAPITIYSGVPKCLNVFSIYSEQQIIIPSVDPHPLRMWDVVTQRGIFRFVIRITASDCKPIDVTVEGAMGEVWHRPKIRLLP